MADDLGPGGRDGGLTALLETVAESGAAAARPAPPAQLRHTADVRTSRRRLVTAAVMVLAVVAGGAALAGGPGTTDSGPPPANGSATLAPAPTQLATPDETYRHRPLQQEMLITPQDARAVGGDWSYAPDRVRGRDLLTPCQTAPLDIPPGGGSTATTLSIGPVGMTLAQLVADLPDEDAATETYSDVVGWFTDCDGALDESDAKGSVVRRAAAAPPVPGIDDLRILVIRRHSTGPDDWAGTVVAVMRIDNLVSLLAWDTSTDDDPPALDDGFGALTRIAATRLAGLEARHVAVPDAALLTADDPAVAAAIGPQLMSSVASDSRIPWMNPLCNHRNRGPAPGTLSARSVQLAGTDATGIALEYVTLYESVAAARAAAEAAVGTATQCAESALYDGTSNQLPAPAPPGTSVAAWGATYEDYGTFTRYRGVIRKGDVVAYLLVDGLNRQVTSDQAIAILETAAQRLVAGS